MALASFSAYCIMIDSINPEDIRSIDSLMVDLPTLRATTENFDEGKKLGEGGFGAVYKVLTIFILLLLGKDRCVATGTQFFNKIK
jgi:hypothetical protein